MSQPTTATGKLLTPFNIVTGVILAVGAVITVQRFFISGLAGTTNLTDNYPWGLWIGFDVMSGVALAAGGFVISSAVYLFGMKEYQPLVRPAILTGFLGYALVVVGLLYDLGRWYRLPYPFVVKPGPTSMLFEVGLCVALYLTTLAIEFSPAALEWLGWKRLRKLVGSMTIALTILGLMLSTMHQSSLGALFLIAPTKLHPLWYSSHLPVHFFISAVAAGLSMVVVESALSHRVFHDQVEITSERFEKLTVGLAKAAAVTLVIYLGVKLIDLAMNYKWHWLGTGYGAWYLVEMLGFVALPCLLYVIGYRERKLLPIRVAAVLTVLGIVLNRLNVSVFAFNWQLPAADRYFPSWMEVWVTVSIVTAGLGIFRFIVKRMPILHEHPQWRGQH